ncbi:MAG: hypothetical protein AAGA96_08850 [Verrucomicrobiota bacterium]
MKRGLGRLNLAQWFPVQLGQVVPSLFEVTMHRMRLRLDEPMIEFCNASCSANRAVGQIEEDYGLFGPILSDPVMRDDPSGSTENFNKIGFRFYPKEKAWHHAPSG